MNTSLTKKPFLDYESQIQTLKSKNLLIKDESSAIDILNKISYYALINGYKDCFKNSSTHLFINSTTFTDIYNLYLFDADLRAIFLKYILVVERHIKSSISYHFTSTHGNGIMHYQDFSNYDFNNIGRAELGKMLIILTKFRNICAHGNRLFNTHLQDAILDCIAHQKLHIPKKDSLYACGKSDLFAAVIALKYLLDTADFRAFYYELKRAIKKYHPSDNTLKSMGFPINWMSILRIKVH